MNEIIKLLDSNLNYIDHSIIDDTIYIFVESLLDVVMCPFCGTLCNKAHSKYQRSFQDLPIQGKKVEVIIHNRKMFCLNENCDHTTFAERFSFL